MIIVDLVGVGPPEATSLTGTVEDEARQIAAYDGVVDLITLATFAQEGDTPLTRVEIVMAAEGWAKILATENGLEIRVILGAEEVDMAATGESEDDFSSETGADGAMVSEPWGADDAQGIESDFESSDVAMSMSPPPAASQLTQISFVSAESHTRRSAAARKKASAGR